jgi:hypothetical protein
VLGVHIHRSPAQIDKLGFGMLVQDFLALRIVYRNREKIPLSIGTEQGGRCDRVQLAQFIRIQVNRDLPLIGAGKQTATSPQGNETGGVGCLCFFHPFHIVTIFHQPVEAHRCEAIAA